MMKMYSWIPRGAAVALLACMALPAGAAHIDTFEAGPFTFVVGGVEGGTISGPASEILGGAREVGVSSASPPGGVSLTVDSPDVVDNGAIVTFSDRGQAEFLYGAPFVSLTPLNADFVNVPGSPLDWTRIEVDLDFDDDFTFGGDVSVGLFSNGTGHSLNRRISAGQQTVVFLYSDFLAVNPNLDLTDIDGVNLLIEGNRGQTYVVSSFARAGAIPTPAALPAGLALLGAIGMIRRHRPRLRSGN